MKKLLLLLLFASPLFAANSVYLGNVNAGTADGSSCANAKIYTYFNSSGNWSATPSGVQIGPDTTVNLCGTITVSSGSGLTAQGNGSSGHPVIVMWQPGATLQSAAFPGDFGSAGGGVVIDGHNYITVDGGVNGVLQNTANGTGLAHSASSHGIYLHNATGITIQNLTVRAIYANLGNTSSATDTNGQDSADISLNGGGTLSGITIQNSVLTAARYGIGGATGGTTITNLTVSGNTISDHCFMMELGFDTSTAATNVNLHDNELTNWQNWQWPNTTYHTDGFIMEANGATSPTPVINMYNNYVHGNLGNGNTTAFFFCTDTVTNAAFSCNIYNNYVVLSGSGGCTFVNLSQTGGPHVMVNNTVVGFSGDAIACSVANPVGGNTGGLRSENNVFVLYAYYVLTDDSNFTNFTTSDYNDFYQFINLNACSGGCFASSMTTSYTYAAASSANTWQGTLSKDAHSITTNPNLSALGVPNLGSPLISAGTNLTSLALPGITSDKAGCARPASGAWDIGAYQFGCSGPPPPPPLPGTQVNPGNQINPGVNISSVAPPTDLRVVSIGGIPVMNSPSRVAYIQ